MKQEVVIILVKLMGSSCVILCVFALFAIYVTSFSCSAHIVYEIIEENINLSLS